MPKKFAGENSKAVVAKARKQAVRDEESAKKQKAMDDAYWKDDDKQLVKKQQKKVFIFENSLSELQEIHH
jgi:hypothetical protein